MDTHPEQWLTRPQLAERWQLPKHTLDVWASSGRGPKYAKFGKHSRYRLSDILDFENGQMTGGAA